MRVATGTWVLVATIAGSSMGFIDGTAVNVALPLMQRDLHAGAAQLQWIVEGYSLFLSSLILVGGSLGDQFGRRRMFVVGTVVFALASIVCAVTSDVNVLIGARCVQGIGAALEVPGSLALISAVFSGEARGKAIGTWSGFSAVTSALGPVLGGWLAQTYSWRAVFLINIPLAAIVVAISLLRVPESHDEFDTTQVDFIGAILATLGLGGIVFGLIGLQVSTQTAFYQWCMVAGAVLLVAFGFFERFGTRAPMLHASLFRSKPFVGANIYTLLLYAALGGSLYFVPFDLINVQHYTPVAAGAALLPFIVIMALASRWSGGLVSRIGARMPLFAGAVLAAAGFFAFARTGIGGSYWTTFFPASILLGLGGACFVAPLTTTVMDSVDTSEAGLASGVNNAASRVAGLLAVAGLGLALAAVFDATLDRTIPPMHLQQPTLVALQQQRNGILSGHVNESAIPAPDRDRVAGAIGSAYVDGFARAMEIAAALSLAAGIMALFWDWGYSSSGTRPLGLKRANTEAG